MMWDSPVEQLHEEKGGESLTGAGCVVGCGGWVVVGNGWWFGGSEVGWMVTHPSFRDTATLPPTHPVGILKKRGKEREASQLSTQPPLSIKTTFFLFRSLGKRGNLFQGDGRVVDYGGWVVVGLPRRSTHSPLKKNMRKTKRDTERCPTTQPADH